MKYGVRLAMDEKYKALKKSLSELTDIPTNQILLVEILGPVVKVSFQLSHVMKKPVFCKYDNKNAEQPLCFRYIDNTIPLPSKSKILGC